MPSILWHIEKELEVESTNDLVLERARSGEPEGLVICARTQTKGRGRRGRTWYSPPEQGLYFSSLLRPPTKAEEIPLISLIVGIAAADGLMKCGACSVGLKWPNDLRINRKKVGGILCEFENFEGPSPAVVAGVGINLHSPPDKYPESFRSEATSLESEGCKNIDADSALNLILEQLELWYQSFLEQKFVPIKNRWEELCDHIGQEIQVSSADGAVPGKAVGLNDKGCLILKMPDGRLREFDSGEVSVR